MHLLRSRLLPYVAAGLILGLTPTCDDDVVDIEFPTPIDDHWWGGFDSQGLNDFVNVLGEFEGELVAGGLFTAAGPVEARGIARWDGTSWSPFGQGMTRDGCPSFSCAPWVGALLPFEGDLVAGGSFAEADGKPAANIARWDGASWSAMGDGLDNSVYALAEYQGEIVAGGAFTRSGADTTLRHLARWDGTAWKPFGGGTNDLVRTLLPWGSSLVVGGDFTEAGGDSAGYVGVWDGQNWSFPAPFLDHRVRSAVLSQGALVLGGEFSATRDGSTTGRVLSWDGREWGAFAGLYGVVTSLCLYNDRLVAGGTFADTYHARIARYETDQGWLGLGSGLDRYAMAMLAHDGHLYVGGWFREAGGKPSRYIARWDD